MDKPKVQVVLKTYLGDSVYSEWHQDRRMFAVYTDNGLGAQNMIWFEEEVFQALVLFHDRVYSAEEARLPND